MKSSIEKLHQISLKTERIVIGLMSGTSFDGLDISLSRFIGAGHETRTQLLEFATVPFGNALKERIKTLVSQAKVDLQELTTVNAFLGSLYAELVLEQLSEWKWKAADVDVIASHGQTIFHSPQPLHKDGYPSATLQIADGDHIAVKTGIITLSDFRQKHLAAGGQGAPLVPYGDFLLFRSGHESRFLLNIGGISNFTFIPAGAHFDQVLAADLGPGNTLMDQYVQKHFAGHYFDKDAAIAQKGRVNNILLDIFLDEPFFTLPFPRSTGPELFNLKFVDGALLRAHAQDLVPEDVLATLNRFTAISIANGLQQVLPGLDAAVYVSGGGMHNPLLMANLKQLMPGARVQDTSVLGIKPDAKEAVLFALLANEALAGDRLTFDNAVGIPSLSFGKISLPD